MRRLGALALVFYTAHAVELLARFPPENLLWSCNVASLSVALGLLGGSPTWTAAGGLLLLAGEPLWIIDLASGGAFMPTSPLTHLGVAAIALYGMRARGIPGRAWLAGAALLAVALLAAQRCSSVAENVNLARAIPPGWEFFPSHGAYLLFLGTSVCAEMLGLQLLLRRLLQGRGR